MKNPICCLWVWALFGVAPLAQAQTPSLVFMGPDVLVTHEAALPSTPALRRAQFTVYHRQPQADASGDAFDYAVQQVAFDCQAIGRSRVEQVQAFQAHQATPVSDRTDTGPWVSHAWGTAFHSMAHAACSRPGLPLMIAGEHLSPNALLARFRGVGQPPARALALD